MEPGLGDREWVRDDGGREVTVMAAMEPGLGDREWLESRSEPRFGGDSAAMEPGLGDREWSARAAQRSRAQ